MLELLSRPDLSQDSKEARCYARLKHLLEEIATRDLGPALQEKLKVLIQDFNGVATSDKAFKKKCSGTYRRMVNLLVKEAQLVPRHYYRTLWTGLGMSAFGIPIGVAMGISLDNMAFLGVGLPIGLAVGVAIGTSMDQKAANEGRQLDISA